MATTKVKTKRYNPTSPAISIDYEAVAAAREEAKAQVVTAISSLSKLSKLTPSDPIKVLVKKGRSDYVNPANFVQYSKLNTDELDFDGCQFNLLDPDVAANAKRGEDGKPKPYTLQEHRIVGLTVKEDVGENKSQLPKIDGWQLRRDVDETAESYEKCLALNRLVWHKYILPLTDVADQLLAWDDNRRLTEGRKPALEYVSLIRPITMKETAKSYVPIVPYLANELGKCRYDKFGTLLTAYNLTLLLTQLALVPRTAGNSPSSAVFEMVVTDEFHDKFREIVLGFIQGVTRVSFNALSVLENDFQLPGNQEDDDAIKRFDLFRQLFNLMGQLENAKYSVTVKIPKDGKKRPPVEAVYPSSNPKKSKSASATAGPWPPIVPFRVLNPNLVLTDIQAHSKTADSDISIYVTFELRGYQGYWRPHDNIVDKLTGNSEVARERMLTGIPFAEDVVIAEDEDEDEDKDQDDDDDKKRKVPDHSE